MSHDEFYEMQKNERSKFKSKKDIDEKEKSNDERWLLRENMVNVGVRTLELSLVSICEASTLTRTPNFFLLVSFVFFLFLVPHFKNDH